MILQLKIISPSQLINGQESEHSFDELGGTIGRKPGNDFVLMDPERYISGKHALIEWRNGQFYITDISTNGVYLNNSKTPLGKGNSSEIMSGDKITIGTYQLLAYVKQDSDEKPLEPKQWEAPLAPTPPSSASEPDFLSDLVSDASEPQAPSYSSDSVDPLALLGDASPEQEKHPLPLHIDENLFGETEPLPPGTPELDNILGDIDSFDEKASIEKQPPPINIDEPFTPPANLIPEDWDIFGEENPPAEPESGKEAKATPGAEPADLFSNLEPEPPAPVAESTMRKPAATPLPETSKPADTSKPGLSAEQLLNAFYQGCGVDPATVTCHDPEQLMRKLGQITRISVIGLMQALRARASLKSGFRVNKTTIAPVENNPLKFSVNFDDAISIILSEDKKGYMSAVDAFKEGFDDLQTHQMAMMAGMQATIAAIIDQFNPEELEAMFERQSGSSFIPGQKKLKNWEHYVDFYNRLTERLQDDFQNIYGEEFAKAYEEQVAKLSK